MSFEIPLHTFHVVFEDGREFKVDTDQRDQRRGFMIAQLNPSEDQVGGIRAIAWAALTRTRQLEGCSWPEFDRICTWVLPETEQVEFVDPTSPAGDV